MLKLKNNLVGEKFGKLTVIEFSHKNKGHAYYLCVCDCGNKKLVRGSHLISGNVTSCGCARKDREYKRINDLTGQRFGKLTVLSYMYSDKHRFSHYLCQCDCGNKKVICANALISGRTKSCGCARYDNSKPKKPRDRSKWASYDRLYRMWYCIKDRCYNTNSKSYKKYGAKGIDMFDKWKNDFLTFKEWALNNGYKPTLTIDRIDNSKGYYPDNCRFADYYVQNNNRTCNRNITIDDETHTVSEWSRINNIPCSTIYNRLNSGWSEYEAVTIPPKH